MTTAPLPAPSPELVARIAPSGTLRAAINLGNAVLAGRDAATGAAKGVTVDLAGELARRLGVPLELVVVDGAAKSVDAVVGDRADVGFFAIDPQRGAEIAFTPPYVLIEGCYLVRADSKLHANEEVDRAGHVVVVGQGSAYDLHLTRALQHATIVRAPTSQAVVQTFLEQDADVAAGVRQQLEADAKRLGGVRLLDGRFMVIRQAMGIAKRRGDDAARWLAGFVERAKAEGAVAAALARHGVDGASVAPAEAQERTVHEGSCHCGAVRLTLPSTPTEATQCNCSLCRRIGGPWVYFEFGTVRITGHPENTAAYVQGDRTLRTIRCRTCGCVTHWEPLPPTPGARHGVHLGNFDPALIASVRVRRFDGADTWRYLDDEPPPPVTAPDAPR